MENIPKRKKVDSDGKTSGEVDLPFAADVQQMLLISTPKGSHAIDKSDFRAQEETGSQSD